MVCGCVDPRDGRLAAAAAASSLNLGEEKHTRSQSLCKVSRRVLSLSLVRVLEAVNQGLALVRFETGSIQITRVEGGDKSAGTRKLRTE